jgi:FkbM family methyltransferase
MWIRRLSLLKAFFSPRRNFPMQLRDLLMQGVFKRTSASFAPHLIESVSREGDHLLIKLCGVATPLYWPRTLPLNDLYHVLTECFDLHNWHFYEVPETQVMPGSVVLDCGAAEGAFAVRVLERAKRVILFEPQPLFVTSLRRTFQGIVKADVIPDALGSVAGEAQLVGDSIYGQVTRDAHGISVRVTTIDVWVAETGLQVDYIKGDLESHELDVLKGARQTIEQYQPKMALTVYHPGNEWSQILGYVRSLVPTYRYRIKGLSYLGNKPRPVMIHLWTE